MKKYVFKRTTRPTGGFTITYLGVDVTPSVDPVDPRCYSKAADGLTVEEATEVALHEGSAARSGDGSFDMAYAVMAQAYPVWNRPNSPELDVIVLFKEYHARWIPIPLEYVGILEDTVDSFLEPQDHLRIKVNSDKASFTYRSKRLKDVTPKEAAAMFESKDWHTFGKKMQIAIVIKMNESHE